MKKGVEVEVRAMMKEENILKMKMQHWRKKAETQEQQQQQEFLRMLVYLRQRWMHLPPWWVGSNLGSGSGGRARQR